MSRPHPALARPLVIALAAGLALTGCAGVPKMPGRKSAEPVTMAPIPNPPEGPAKSAEATPPRPRPSTARPASKPARAAAPAAPAQPRANSARAAQLRASGLEQLNRGSIERAVALLRQASQLDPGNALIQRDLERAVRISDAVRAKPR